MLPPVFCHNETRCRAQFRIAASELRTGNVACGNFTPLGRAARRTSCSIENSRYELRSSPLLPKNVADKPFDDSLTVVQVERLRPDAISLRHASARRRGVVPAPQ